MLSNQSGPHQNLVKIVLKHRDNLSQKPFSEHSQAAFETAQSWLQDRAERPLIFDSCCGVGQSSRQLAAAHPQCLVLAVDKSEHRLQRADHGSCDNLLYLRADLNDFYRLASTAGWRLHKHYILYPNPWPKSAHLGRRWHAAPVFPQMLSLGGDLELRTNWLVYAREFQIALQQYQMKAELAELQVNEGAQLTPFEAKYNHSGQTLWQLTASLSNHC